MEIERARVPSLKDVGVDAVQAPPGVWMARFRRLAQDYEWAKEALVG